jgi:hypothetical protein
MSTSQYGNHDSSDDLRLASRYAMQVPVEILMENGSRLRVFTHNISASGIFVRVEKNLQLSGILRFLLTFPKEITTSCRLLALCDGAVIRREPMDADAVEGLAIKIEKYHFLRSAN